MFTKTVFPDAKPCTPRSVLHTFATYVKTYQMHIKLLPARHRKYHTGSIIWYYILRSVLSAPSPGLCKKSAPLPPFTQGSQWVQASACAQGTHGVEDSNDHNADIREYRGAHIGCAEGYQQQAGKLNAEGENDIFIDYTDALTRDPYRL